MAQVVPSYSNSLQQQVIAAAEAAGFEIPANIAATYAEHGAARRSNQWHVALGLASDGTAERAAEPISAARRQAAYDGLRQFAEWAEGLRQQPEIQASLRSGRRAERNVRTAQEMSPMLKVRQSMAVDDALQLPLLAQVYRDPVDAQKQIRAVYKTLGDPQALADQLELTPDSFGDLVGTRMAMVDGPQRRHAMKVLRTQIIADLRNANLPSRMAARTLEQPSAAPASGRGAGQGNRTLLAFDDAVTRFTKAFQKLTDGGVLPEIDRQAAAEERAARSSGSNRRSNGKGMGRSGPKT